MTESACKNHHSITINRANAINICGDEIEFGSFVVVDHLGQLLSVKKTFEEAMSSADDIEDEFDRECDVNFVTEDE